MLSYRKIQAQETHLLRQKILRPHQEIEEMFYPYDDHNDTFHLGCFDKEKLVGVLSMYHEDRNSSLSEGGGGV